MSEIIDGCNCKGDGCYTWFSPKKESGLCDRCEERAEHQQHLDDLTAQLRAAEQERDRLRRISSIALDSPQLQQLVEEVESLGNDTPEACRAIDAMNRTLALKQRNEQVRALRERAERTLIWLKWFVGDDNVATALRIAQGRGCAPWQLEEIKRLWEGGEGVSESEWKERAERAEGVIRKIANGLSVPGAHPDFMEEDDILEVVHEWLLSSTPTPAAQEGE